MTHTVFLFIIILFITPDKCGLCMANDRKVVVLYIVNMAAKLFVFNKASFVNIKILALSCGQSSSPSV